MSINTMKALKRCPFCRGSANVTLVSDFRISTPRTGWRVNCSTCSAQTGAFGLEEGAVDAWNTRAALQAEPAAPVAEGAVLPPWWNDFITRVCEIPERNSPEDEPEAIVATARELENCALNAIEQHAITAPPVAPEPVDSAPLTVEQLALEECLQLGYSVVEGTLRPPESPEWSELATSLLRVKGFLRD